MQKNPYLSMKEPQLVEADASKPRRSWRHLLDTAPRATPLPSIDAAKKFEPDLNRYTAREREQAALAQDFNGASLNALSFVSGTSFPGMPTLALLAQLPEYRTMHETLADECVRCWGKVTARSTDPLANTKIRELEAELERIDLRAAVHLAVIHDQAFGGAHVFFALKSAPEPDLPMLLSNFSIPRGSFEGVRVIEPYWVTPNNYNSIDPTSADFYKPSSWWALSRECHATRLQTLVSRPVPDMLKPTYSFRGVSMTQLAMPYVDNWLRTRQSVSDTVKQFSISGIKSDLAQALQPGGGMDLAARAELINLYRDNRNILFLDSATEEFFQVNTPLTSLDALQAQAQEQMAAVSHIPLVKLLGITPTGLNASAEGEIRVFYDYVRGYQHNTLMAFMLNVLRVAQLSLFGEIDNQIVWEWAPLLELTALEQADLRLKDADTDTRYLESGVLLPEQVAETLSNDAHSRYTGVAHTTKSLSDIPDTDFEGIAQYAEQLAETQQLAVSHEAPSTGVESVVTDPSAQGDPGQEEPKFY